jgi:hypothetical protein
MATGRLEEFLRRVERNLKANPPVASTLAGIGPGGWDSSALATSQGQAPADGALLKTKTVYRIYTEDVFSISRRDEIIGRYFDGATIYYGTGLDARTQDARENALIIEIVTSKPDQLQRIANLAGDLRVAGKQISVLVTRATVDTFEVTE